MNLYACYTRSHKPLVDQHFRPSLPAEFKGKLRLKLLPQRGVGEFDTEGFGATCLRKMEFLAEACRTEKEPFLFSDVDVRFYGPVVADLTAQLGDLDMIFQWDGRPSRARECTGFFVVRPSPRTRILIASVVKRMRQTGEYDQDAMHWALDQDRELKTGFLCARYWTWGRMSKIWEPGQPVAPPANLLVHHGNWTKGIKNKLALLEAVAQTRVAASVAVIEADRRVPASPQAVAASPAPAPSTRPTWHNPMPLALVLQFWRNDKSPAMELARLIADIEPEWRDDVIFVFARQVSDGKSNTPLDREIVETQHYVGMKMPWADMPVRVDEKKKYPGICFDPWAHACERLSKAYHTGMRAHHSAFFFEADGFPLSYRWIDELKDAHAMTLAQGKRVTGPLMQLDPHVNGTMIMHLSCWDDHPSLYRCPPRQPWDIFHGQVLLNEAGIHTKSNIIANRYGDENMSSQVWHTTSINSCWGTSCKDGMGQYWARRFLVEGKDTHTWYNRNAPLPVPAVATEPPVVSLVGSESFRLLARAYEEKLSLIHQDKRIELVGRQLGTNVVEAFAIVKALDSVRKLPGDVCEFGVAQGEASALIANEILPTRAHLHLFDSFAGLSKPTTRDRLQNDVLKLGSMAAYEGKMACPESMVLARLADVGFPSDRVQIHRGFVHQVLAENVGLPRWVKFAYFDMDLYEPARDVLDFLSRVAVRGAVIIVDDYDFFTSGPREAVEEFLTKHKDFKLIRPKDMKFILLDRRGR